MEHHVALVVAIVTLVLGAVIVFTLYRSQQRRRGRHVTTWVRDFVQTRYGRLPTDLRIDCSDDQLWPVLVSFREPSTGTQRYLRFSCHGPQPRWHMEATQRGPLTAAPLKTTADAMRAPPVTQ
jgi:hypothetical protein